MIKGKNIRLICEKCNCPMIIIGVTDKGNWKWYCSECYQIIEKK